LVNKINDKKNKPYNIPVSGKHKLIIVNKDILIAQVMSNLSFANY